MDSTLFSHVLCFCFLAMSFTLSVLSCPGGPIQHELLEPRLCMPMASRLEVRVEVRDRVKFVKVVIEKVDDRNAERIMHTEIQDRFVIKSPPTDVPVIS